MNSQRISNSTSANIVALSDKVGGLVKNAKVTAVEGKSLELVYGIQQNNQRRVKGIVAFSCLVVVQVNDIVACVQNETGEHIVLAVIERPEDDRADSQDMTLQFPASANFQCLSGDFGISANNKVSIVAGRSLSCASQETTHISRRASIDFQNITASGERITAKYRHLHLLSDVINTFAKQLMQRVDNYVRRSTTSDQVSAAHMDRKVDGLYNVTSQTTIMNSKNDTKIDGQRIHMG